jgi:hypothetical protein
MLGHRTDGVILLHGGVNEWQHMIILRHQSPRSGTVAWQEQVASLPDELDPVLQTEGSLGAVSAD